MLSPASAFTDDMYYLTLAYNKEKYTRERSQKHDDDDDVIFFIDQGGNHLSNVPFSWAPPAEESTFPSSAYHGSDQTPNVLGTITHPLLIVIVVVALVYSKFPDSRSVTTVRGTR